MILVVTVGASTASLPALLAGRYRILSHIGRGAIAQVVRARDEKTGEEVALKLLYPHLRESATVVERFRREIEVVRRISHAHVLAIHGVVDSDGQLFLVMDYHPGGDLADRLARSGRLPAEVIRDLAAQLCGALGAAHRAGVVHRDVKPSNVLCGPAARLDLRLCDFGLARTAESGLTSANAVLGTPEYMAPEIVTDGQADPRSDIYSLGVVLFEAATGRLPFYGESPYQLMRAHVDLEAPRARSLAPDLPSAIDDAIARALAKDPLDRFATAEDLARAFADQQSSVPALAPSSEGPPSRKTCSRCGGWMSEEARVCVDCGHVPLHLDRDRGGTGVLVYGPGKKWLTSTACEALYKVLDELPAGTVRRRSAPRIPFYVAKGIHYRQATVLAERLGAVGLQAVVQEAWSPVDRALFEGMDESLWKRVVIPCAALIGWTAYVVFGIAGVVGLMGLVALGVGALLVEPTLRSVRPLVTRRSKRAKIEGAARRLADAVPRLESRLDRRLCAHVLEKLGRLESADRKELLSPVADRATKVAGALAALDARRRADASVPQAPAFAIEELRREEQLRVVLRSDLLRTASVLDRITVARAHAKGDALVEIASIDEQVGEQSLMVDAERELAALLGGER